ncbi:MAG: response regulator [Candidatus Eisenbacteria bacterium]|nr:response regulator [Candidatus Eisenbacteria bacterium]
MAKARIMLVDDHPIVRQGLSQMINREMDLEVAWALPDAGSALEAIDKERPDLVVVDISLPDVGGLELVKQIRALDEELPILVCSMHDESLYAERCLHAGARGYIAKSESSARVVEAIRRVLDGKVYLSERMSERVLNRMVNTKAEVGSSPIEALSDRELEVFELIGRGETTRSIAQALNLSMKTIETYRENIKLKFGLKNSTELIRHAVGWMESR